MRMRRTLFRGKPGCTTRRFPHSAYQSPQSTWPPSLRPEIYASIEVPDAPSLHAGMPRLPWQRDSWIPTDRGEITLKDGMGVHSEAACVDEVKMCSPDVDIQDCKVTRLLFASR